LKDDLSIVLLSNVKIVSLQAVFWNSEKKKKNDQVIIEKKRKRQIHATLIEYKKKRHYNHHGHTYIWNKCTRKKKWNWQITVKDRQDWIEINW